MTFRYIGSKARVVSQIVEALGRPDHSSGRFVDMFCGTGAVALEAAKAGWSVHLNDHLHCAVIVAEARVASSATVPFMGTGGYKKALEYLNNLHGEEGFFFNQYSPASTALIGFERRYFTTQNAARIDAMRRQIAVWKSIGEITASEERLLLADLLSAANRVANIAGTYGCFLSKWQAQARASIELRPRELGELGVSVTVSVQDVGHVKTFCSDVAYLDPPYTKRQYAAYYHLLETLVLDDSPIVEGVAGIRPWRQKASDFCYRSRAVGAFATLIGKLNAERVLISYSDNAHIPIDTLTTTASAFGDTKPFKLRDIARYRPNKVASSGRAVVSEYLIELDRRTVVKAVA